MCQPAGYVAPVVGDSQWSGHGHLEVVTGQVPGRAVGMDERAVDEGIAAVRVAHQGQRDVGAVGQVHREPVPAASADRDEVAPLVVEPGSRR